MNVAFETSTLPDPGTPTDPYDLITLGFLDSEYSKKRRVTGTWSAPVSQDPAVSVAHGLLATEDECIMFLKSNGGAGVLSGSPIFAAGTRNGQVLRLVFTSDTDTLFLQDGGNLRMKNGSRRSLADTVLIFHWDSVAAAWREESWNNVGDVV